VAFLLYFNGSAGTTNFVSVSALLKTILNNPNDKVLFKI